MFTHKKRAPDTNTQGSVEKTLSIVRNVPTRFH